MYQEKIEAYWSDPARERELVAAISRLVAVKSVKGEAEPGKPFGAGPAAALDEAGVWYCGGKNSPYIWLRCPNNMGSWEFFDWLLETANVVGTPGEGFGPCGKGYFRLTAFGDAARTKEAAARIKAALAAL